MLRISRNQVVNSDSCWARGVQISEGRAETAAEAAAEAIGK